MIRDPSDGSVKGLSETTGQPQAKSDLRGKHGANWGLAGDDKPEIRRVPALTTDQLRHHYQHYDLAFRPKQTEE